MIRENDDGRYRLSMETSRSQVEIIVFNHRPTATPLVLVQRSRRIASFDASFHPSNSTERPVERGERATTPFAFPTTKRFGVNRNRISRERSLAAIREAHPS